mgnify:FL=1
MTFKEYELTSIYKFSFSSPPKRLTLEKKNYYPKIVGIMAITYFLFFLNKKEVKLCEENGLILCNSSFLWYLLVNYLSTKYIVKFSLVPSLARAHRCSFQAKKLARASHHLRLWCNDYVMVRRLMKHILTHFHPRVNVTSH